MREVPRKVVPADIQASEIGDVENSQRELPRERVVTKVEINKLGEDFELVP